MNVLSNLMSFSFFLTISREIVIIVTLLRIIVIMARHFLLCD